MKCGYYWIVNPPPSEITDKNRVPVVGVTVKLDKAEHIIRQSRDEELTRKEKLKTSGPGSKRWSGIRHGSIFGSSLWFNPSFATRLS